MTGRSPDEFMSFEEVKMENTPPIRIKVFWQPGCSSCLRTKEFLTKQGIEFESIDVHNNPDGMAQLRALGARSVPVVSLGKKYTLCQSFDDVIRFLGLNVELNGLLPPAQLIAKLDLVLAAAARYTLQFPPGKFRLFFRDRQRSAADTAYHVFRVAEMGFQAAQQIELLFEGFNDLPPADWSARDIADWGLGIRQKIRHWWEEDADQALEFTVPTYYGRRSMHNVLERTTWHAAQHTRQLILMLEEYGVRADRPLSTEDLKGLPVPEKVWDN
ncbi:glutaredoxin domain-containing protein [Pollutimonas sp. M17]|uniref:glutaredoxin domain-containing protein n=1 Tax=Pollutimonas sp. M17 TaxID=2962065 RepID=UPI0021F4A1BF|nr:glutaredoxin domain-containing protein [Pollutimonas sp. M17]UYO94615.1 NrdH-redoxin [Pollutimonas sp. M17]